MRGDPEHYDVTRRLINTRKKEAIKVGALSCNPWQISNNVSDKSIGRGFCGNQKIVSAMAMNFAQGREVVCCVETMVCDIRARQNSEMPPTGVCSPCHVAMGGSEF